LSYEIIVVMKWRLMRFNDDFKNWKMKYKWIFLVSLIFKESQKSLSKKIMIKKLNWNKNINKLWIWREFDYFNIIRYVKFYIEYIYQKKLNY
jgi:hypothetical protein